MNINKEPEVGGAALPCPHARQPIDGVDGWKHCPHCLGLNNPTHTQPPVLDSIDDILEPFKLWGGTAIGYGCVNSKELSKAKKTIEAYCNKQVVGELERLWAAFYDSSTFDGNVLKRRIAELKAAQPHKGKKS